MKFLKILWERLLLQATLPEIKLALSSKSRDLLSHVISECMQMRGRIITWMSNIKEVRSKPRLHISVNPGGVGHGSRDSIRPIKCRFSRSNGGHIFRCELRIGCRFSTDFCARHEDQTKIFWELLVQYLGQLFGNSQGQVSIFCINFSQWKSYYVENVCLSSMLDMDILLVVYGVTGISILDYFCVKL